MFLPTFFCFSSTFDAMSQKRRYTFTLKIVSPSINMQKCYLETFWSVSAWSLSVWSKSSGEAMLSAFSLRLSLSLFSSWLSPCSCSAYMFIAVDVEICIGDDELLGYWYPAPEPDPWLRIEDFLCFFYFFFFSQNDTFRLERICDEKGLMKVCLGLYFLACQNFLMVS